MMLEIIKYSSEGCGPCRAIKGVFESIQENYSDVAQVIERDVAECSSLAEDDGVSVVPTVIFRKDGVNREVLVGAKPPQNYIEILKRLTA